MSWITNIIDKRINQVTSEQPRKRGKADARIVTKNLDRITKDIAKWREAQGSAEAFDYPDRIELMQIYKDVLDDAQVYSNIQVRINKATSGTFGIFSDGEIDKELSKMFVDNKGFPLPWFRKFLIFAEWSKFYGNELIQLGNIIDGKFESIKKIPEENLIPQWEGFIFDYEAGYSRGNKKGVDEVNFVRYDEKGLKNWLIPVGDPKELGLLNKVTPYMIWKEVFGAWSMHADLFGQPLRIGKTDIADPDLKQNMLDMLAALTQGAYAAIDLEDQLELLTDKKTDVYQIYKELITVCDESISKLILGGTMITDSGSSRSQSEVHERTMSSVIEADKIDLQTLVNESLIPRMKLLGILPEGDYTGAWNMDETLSIQEWADVFQKISSTGFKPSKEDIEKKINITVDEVEIEEPTEMNNVMNLYKDFM